MITKDGYIFIAITGIIFAVALSAALMYSTVILIILAILTFLLFIFNLGFFRDPHRTIPEGEDLILSPADGKIITIDEVEDPHYLKGKSRRVCIFMSAFNVHVNRIPVSGKVEYLKYIKGKFDFAFVERAAEINEQTVIGIRHGKGKITFKQIAGILARRIVWRIKEGDEVITGEKFGMIRYGSRVDMFFPENVEILVNLNQKVLGGETIIGKFK